MPYDYVIAVHALRSIVNLDVVILVNGYDIPDAAIHHYAVKYSHGVIGDNLRLKFPASAKHIVIWPKCADVRVCYLLRRHMDISHSYL